MKFKTLTPDGVTETEVPDNHVLCGHRVLARPAMNPKTGDSLGIRIEIDGHTLDRNPSQGFVLLDAATAGKLVLAVAAAIATGSPESIAAYRDAIFGGGH